MNLSDLSIMKKDIQTNICMPLLIKDAFDTNVYLILAAALIKQANRILSNLINSSIFTYSFTYLYISILSLIFISLFFHYKFVNTYIIFIMNIYLFLQSIHQHFFIIDYINNYINSDYFYQFIYNLPLQMTASFNTSHAFLSQRLFYPDRPRIGANTYLNVNLLPDFIQYIKKNLTSQQIISLSQYQLQTYIMQLSIKQKITDSFDKLVDKILKYIRQKKQFWINGKIIKNKQNQEKFKQQEKHQHQAIKQYHKDISFINAKIPDYPQRIFNNTRKRKIQQSIQTFDYDFFDKHKEFLKFNMTNYSMMPAYVLRQYLKTQKGVDKLPKHEQLNEQQKQLLNSLQNAIQYFIIQQKPRINRALNIKRRQVIRKRKLPFYLVQNIGQSMFQSNIIQEEIQGQIYENESCTVQNNKDNQNTQNKQKQFKKITSQHKQKGFKPIQQQAKQNSQQELSQNEYYNKFNQQIKNKSFYDVKMFSKQQLINKSHNIMQILRCMIYYINEQDNKWFQMRWKELEQQKILKQKRKLEEQREQQQQEDQDDQQDQQNEQEDNQQEKEQNNQQKEQNKQQNKRNRSNIKSRTSSIKQNNQQKIIEQVHHNSNSLHNSNTFNNNNNNHLINSPSKNTRNNIILVNNNQSQHQINTTPNKINNNNQIQNNQYNHSINQTPIQLQNSIPQQPIYSFKSLASLKQLKSSQKNKSHQFKSSLQEFKSFQQLKSLQKLQKSQQSIIQIGIPKPIFNQSWKNPTSFSFRKLSRNLSSQFLSIRQIYFVVKQYLSRQINKQYKKQKQQFIQVQNNSKQLQSCLINPQISLDDIYLEFKQMIEHPQNIKLAAFKTQGIQIPWNQTDYFLFLKGLLQFYFIPTNNRKIATYMMSQNQSKNIQANHVKYVKGIYLKNMQIRIDKGECGGGKKGRMMGKTQFIQKDIQQFSMKWFDKIKKTKKKNRKRRSHFQDAGQQIDSAY